MSVLAARCRWIRASLLTLMGEAGRAVEVSVIDGPNRLLPEGWRGWAPWLADEPDPFLKSLIANSSELASIAKHFKEVRAEFTKVQYSEPREEFRMIFESWLKLPWLLGIDAGECGHLYPDAHPVDEPPPWGQDWILRTIPAPVAYWLVAIWFSPARER